LLDIIIDGKKGFIYIRKNGARIPPEHNRIGAVFTPETMETDNLLAHVLDGSPAYDAGISNGDILLAIDGIDARHWRTNTAVMPMTPFWQRAPGTKTHLKLKRGEKEFETDVMLRNLIGPDVNSESQTNQTPGTNHPISR
jgi:C-terminal processing protease CtpA/Prc